MNLPTAPVVETVLVVEDEVLIRMSVSEYLRECGYRVLEAKNCDEAVIILQKPDIQVDVVLSDVETAGTMNGFAFAQWARSVRPRLEVILAGTIERVTDAAAELCEDNPLLTKPYDPQVLGDRVRRLLAAHGRKPE